MTDAMRLWAQVAQPKEHFTYFTGNLARSCEVDDRGYYYVSRRKLPEGTKLKVPMPPEIEAARAIREAAWRLYEGGLVDLVQHSLGGDKAEYLAIKRQRIAKITPWIELIGKRRR